MRRTFLAVVGLVLMFGSAASSSAQVKRVQMHIAGSRATEYFLAPGLQYAARPRFVIEGSYQFPLVRNAGPLVLHTDRNILVGVKYLF